MAFPTSPTNGQTYTSRNIKYTYNSTADRWEVGTSTFSQTVTLSEITVAGTANISSLSVGTLTSVTMAGSITPSANATYNLGSASYRWNNIYTSDLSLSNQFGDWTIVEGEDDLFLYNNKKGKTYKFMLQEVDPSTAPPKRDQ